MRRWSRFGEVGVAGQRFEFLLLFFTKNTSKETKIKRLFLIRHFQTTTMIVYRWPVGKGQVHVKI